MHNEDNISLTNATNIKEMRGQPMAMEDDNDNNSWNLVMAQQCGAAMVVTLTQTQDQAPPG
jgi:hypothetical protein